MSDVFISYGREDVEVAKRLTRMLQANGHTVFFDTSIVAGQDFSKAVTDAITSAEAVLVLLSRHSERNRWVEEELTIALEKGHTVIPILLDSDAKKNWVWPLISDRKAIRVESNAGLEEVVERVKSAIDSPESHVPDIATENMEGEARAMSSHRWLQFIIPIITAFLGALTAILFFN